MLRYFFPMNWLRSYRDTYRVDIYMFLQFMSNENVGESYPVIERNCFREIAESLRNTKMAFPYRNLLTDIIFPFMLFAK